MQRSYVAARMTKFIHYQLTSLFLFENNTIPTIHSRIGSEQQVAMQIGRDLRRFPTEAQAKIYSFVGVALCCVCGLRYIDQLQDMTRLICF